MAPSLSSTSDDIWSDTTYDDVPSEFFTFSTPLSYRGDILDGSESTSSIPDLNHQGKHSCGFRESNSPKWVPLAIRTPEAPLSFDISVPESPYGSSTDGGCDTSFANSLKDPLAQRRRPTEYFHRPPVWRIQPLKAYNGLSFSGSDSDTNITSDLGITDHLDTCQFCTTAQRKNFPTKKTGSDFRGWFDSQVPSRFSKGFLSYEDNLNAMASTWADEPLVVGMASIPDNFDVELMNEDGGSTSQSKDKGKARDDSQYGSSLSALESSLPSEGKGKATEESQLSLSSSPLKRTQPSKDKGLVNWDGTQLTPSPDPLKRTFGFMGKRKDELQNQQSSSLPKSSSQNALESNSPFYAESGSKTSVPVSDILEDGQADVDANVSDADFVSIRSELPRTGSERHASGKRNRPAGAKDQHTKIDPQSSTTGNPSRIMKPNTPQEWRIFKQDGVCAEKFLDTYKDIRVAPSRDRGNYGIKSGSRVICIGDTNVGSTADDVYSLEVGNAFIILQMYGDLWASCLKLSLTDPIASMPAGNPMWMKNNEDFVWANNPKSIKFLPLCSVTLEANFGEYIWRRQIWSPDSNNSLSPDPCNGQQVDPPIRKQSQLAAASTRDGGNVLIPNWMVKECRKVHKMPDGKLAIPRSDSNDSHVSRYGHVDKLTTRPITPIRKSEGADEPEKRRFFGRQRIGDKLTAKNGKIFGVGKKRTESSADREPLIGNPSSMGKGTTPVNSDAETATENAAMPNPAGDIADTGRTRDSNAIPEGLESSSGVENCSPQRATSQIASNPPNPPQELAGRSAQTEVRDFASGSAAPGSAAPHEARFNDGTPGDVAQSNPSGAAPSNSNPGGVPETVVNSKEEHKEAFAAADQAAPTIGSQPYVSVGEVPAAEEPGQNTSSSTVPAATPKSPRKKSSTFTFNRKSFLKHLRQ